MPLPRRLAPATTLALAVAVVSCTADEPALPPSIPVVADPARTCDPGSTLGTLAQEIGEPETGGGQLFPNWQERIVHVLTNRARSDPAKQMAECVSGAYKACPWAEGASGCYSAKPPLVWDLQTARAARFHATYLSKAPCGLGHNTCCALKSDVDATGCDGDPSCACAAGTQSCDCASACGNATGFGTRLSRFGVSGSGEIAHQYYTDALDIFHGWIDEDLSPASAGSCSMTGKNGHRWLILTSNGPRAGPGYFYKAGNCNSPYWVEDFTSNAATPSRLPGGIHYPQSGSTATDFRFWANYYHPGGGTPLQAQVVVDGACSAMTLEFGTAQNGTYRLDLKLPSGCLSYYFLFVDSAGARHTFPTTGSLAVAVGGTCSSDYTATQLPAGCEASPPDAGTSGPDAAAPGPDAAGPGPDAAGPGPDAAAPGPDAAFAGRDAAAPGQDAAAPGPDAASPGLDAATAGLDAATPGRDSGSTGLDASQVGLDATAPQGDAGAPGADATQAAPDAAATDVDAAALPDASIAAVDGSSVAADAGSSFGPNDAVLSGCGCSTPGAASSLWVWGGFAAAFLARRRLG